MIDSNCTLVFTAIAAIAAAFSAIFSAYTIFRDTKWRKLERTFAHSPTRNPEFLKSIENLEEQFPETFGKPTTQAIGNYKDKTQNGARITRNTETANLVKAANFWGQMAMEYDLGQLDNQVASNLLKVRFMKFCYVFEAWLRDEKRKDIYKNTIKLFKKWRQEELGLNEDTAKRLRKNDS